MLDRAEIINEEFYSDNIAPATYDLRLADGWRHFGKQFFRYNFGIYMNEIRRVLPLRIRLADFQISKSQKRTLRRNADLLTDIAPIAINREIEDLFHRHKRRFRFGVPNSVFDFVSHDSASVPTEGFQIEARLDGRLVAISFFDISCIGVSAIYGCFDPDETRRSLGIFTMLKIIEHARTTGKQFYYHGYAYDGESFYDYKKRFTAIEVFDWSGNWNPMSGQVR